MSELDKHREHKRSSKNGTRSERQAAARHGGTLSSGSGAFHPGAGGSSHRNDFRNDNVSVEWKYTSAESYRLRDADLVKANSEAVVEGHTGLFGIEFSSGNRWIVMAEADYLEQQDDANAVWSEGGMPSGT